jgi:hypothetical protein
MSHQLAQLTCAVTPAMARCVQQGEAAATGASPEQEPPCAAGHSTPVSAGQDAHVELEGARAEGAVVDDALWAGSTQQQQQQHQQGWEQVIECLSGYSGGASARPPSSCREEAQAEQRALQDSANDEILIVE